MNKRVKHVESYTCRRTMRGTSQIAVFSHRHFGSTRRRLSFAFCPRPKTTRNSRPVSSSLQRKIVKLTLSSRVISRVSAPPSFLVLLSLSLSLSLFVTPQQRFRENRVNLRKRRGRLGFFIIIHSKGS